MREQSVPIFFDKKSSLSSQYGNLMQGIRTAASRASTRLDMFSEDQFDEVSFDSLPLVAIVTGVSKPFMQKAISRLRAYDRYVVLAGTDSEQFGHDISCATPSRRTETQQLVNYLYNCGMKSIALVGFGRHSINDNFRYHAAMSAVAAWGNLLREKDVWLWEDDPNESFDRFIEIWDRYDAVICPNDVIAVSLIKSLQKHGIEVPRDLYVASFGNMFIGQYHKPSITSMTMDMVCVGEQAFQVLRFIMKNKKSQQTALKITVPSRLIIRESTANKHVMSEGTSLSPGPQDYFYHNPTIAQLVDIENCLSQRDEIDMIVIREIMDGFTYERICDDLFISSSTLRYRLGKIYNDACVKGREDFENQIHTYLGKDNPFAQSSE